MPRMENNGGDVLARGASSAIFRPMGEKLSQETWDGLTKEENTPVVKALYKFKCEEHGEFVSNREVYLSGGFPLLDEKYATGKCPTCEEKSVYAGYVEIGSDSNGTPSGTSGTDVGEAVASK